MKGLFKAYKKLIKTWNEKIINYIDMFISWWYALTIKGGMNMSEREKSALYPGSTLSDCIEFAKVIGSFKNKTVAYNAVAEKYGLSSCATKSFT